MAATESALGELHDVLAKTLTGLVGVEAPSAAVLAVAAKFLKDNNITCSPATDNAIGALDKAIRDKQVGAKLTAREKAELAQVSGVEHLMH